MNLTRLTHLLQGVLCFLLFVPAAIAQEVKEEHSNDKDPTGAFLGKWKLVSISGPGEQMKTLDVQVAVEDGSFKLSGTDAGPDIVHRSFEWNIPKDRDERPYRILRQRGVKGIDEIVDIERQIVIFWFVGIYRFQGNRLELALKYCGQGLEGEKFENFRPPSTFEGKPDNDEIRIVLKRLDK